MSPAQMLDVLSAAIARAEAKPPSRWPWRRGRQIVLSLRADHVLGYHGQPDGLDLQDVPVWGYTLRQCQQMYEEIITAIRDDMAAGAVPEP